MRQKYIDEKWPVLMIHGHHRHSGDPCVTDCNGTFEIFLERAQASAVVRHYDKLHEEFSDLAKAFSAVNPDAFDRFWYGGERETNPN